MAIGISIRREAPSEMRWLIDSNFSVVVAASIGYDRACCKAPIIPIKVSSASCLLESS
jgi:hypothetical protein